MAGNSNSGGNGKSGKRDVAPMVRAAFLNALEEIKRTEGLTFSQIIARWIREDGIGPVLQAVSKFTVREKEINATITHKSLVDILIHEFDPASSDRENKALEAEPGSIHH